MGQGWQGTGSSWGSEGLDRGVDQLTDEAFSTSINFHCSNGDCSAVHPGRHSRKGVCPRLTHYCVRKILLGYLGECWGCIRAIRVLQKAANAPLPGDQAREVFHRRGAFFAFSRRSGLGAHVARSGHALGKSKVRVLTRVSTWGGKVDSQAGRGLQSFAVPEDGVLNPQQRWWEDEPNRRVVHTKGCNRFDRHWGVIGSQQQVTIEN